MVQVDADCYNRVVQWSESGADMSHFQNVFKEVIKDVLDITHDPSSVDLSFLNNKEISKFEWIPQGGRMPSAESGLRVLAQEIEEFIVHAKLVDNIQGPWKVAYLF